MACEAIANYNVSRRNSRKSCILNMLQIYPYLDYYFAKYLGRINAQDPVEVKTDLHLNLGGITIHICQVEDEKETTCKCKKGILMTYKEDN